jgi:hypothetical protein
LLGLSRHLDKEIKMQSLRISLVATILLVATVSTAWAASVWSQPLTSFQPKEPVDYRLPYGPEASVGDITFSDSYPSASSLTATEKLMIFGGTDPATREPVQPWMKNVLMFCVAHHHRHGNVPATLSPAVISESSPWTEQEAAQQVFFKNPYTNDCPRCNTASPSAGDIYCRPLDDSEMRHVAKKDYILGLLIKGEAPEGNAIRPAKFTMMPWYIRVYGEGGRVIWEGLQYSWSTD